MSDDRPYYNVDQPAQRTYLEFGYEPTGGGERSVYERYQDQQAYDMFMLARYSNDLVTYQIMTERLSTSNVEDMVALYHDGVQTADFPISVAKHSALAAAAQLGGHARLRLLELGSTLFGCIEAHDFLNRLLEVLEVPGPRIQSRQLTYHGIEISDLLIRVGRQLHRAHEIHTSTAERLPPDVDLFYSKGVTLLYAIDNVPDLFRMLDSGTFALFDVSFSLDGPQRAVIGTGKHVVYLPFRAFRDYCRDRTEKRLYLQRSSSSLDARVGRVRGQAAFATPAAMGAFVGIDTQLRSALNERLAKLNCRAALIGAAAVAGALDNDWRRADDVVPELEGSHA